MSLTRTEYKFVISTEQRQRLETEIAQRLNPDEAPGTEGLYPIVSQYYDSPERECYWEKMRRLQSRRKIRVRMYGSDKASIPPAAFLEIKHKHFGEGGKRRLQVPVDVARRFVAGEHEPLRAMRDEVGRSGRMVIDEVFDLIDNYGHVPSMQIRYDRTAFTSSDFRFRITFDSHVVCRSVPRPLVPDDPHFEDEVLDPDSVMMEVKSIGPVPYWFRQWTAKEDLCRQSFSKYCTALERHDPVLRGMLFASA